MRNKTVPVVLFLAALAADPSEAYSPIPIPDMDHTELHRAAENCDPERAKAELEPLLPAEKAAAIDRLDREGYTPLAYAAENGCLEIARLLVESGASVEKAEEYSGWTPLLRAALHRRPEVARYLLERGANANVKASVGATPLTEAVLGSVFESGSDRDGTIAALLDHGADVNLPGRNGWTALMTAVFRGDAGLVRRLLERGADPSLRDETGKTALDHARERGNPETIGLLGGEKAESKS